MVYRGSTVARPFKVSRNSCSRPPLNHHKWCNGPLSTSTSSKEPTNLEAARHTVIRARSPPHSQPWWCAVHCTESVCT